MTRKLFPDIQLVSEAPLGETIEIVYPRQNCLYPGGMYRLTTYQDVKNKVRALDRYGHPVHLHPLNFCRKID